MGKKAAKIMAKQTETQEQENVNSASEGIRAKVSSATLAWLTNMEELTGLSRGELLDAMCENMQANGREFLVQAIMSKANSAISKL